MCRRHVSRNKNGLLHCLLDDFGLLHFDRVDNVLNVCVDNVLNVCVHNVLRFILRPSVRYLDDSQRVK